MPPAQPTARRSWASWRATSLGGRLDIQLVQTLLAMAKRLLDVLLHHGDGNPQTIRDVPLRQAIEMEQYEDRAALRAQFPQRRFQRSQPLLPVEHTLGMRCGANELRPFRRHGIRRVP